ncbi:carbohydrate kinase, pfkb family protein [Halorubrum aidingense JCM 13560]|uniref:Carbohydrate kinase, pfkb family protein n=1 Tax=Halorubrum aidingense JCM 13560 TaxID=1230454 RepID=M0PM87_9EURY|nr:carbohydrate kinase, pfkb family protein [Halorubrum aidingense JCM 13560]
MLVVGDATIDLYPTDATSITPGSRFEWHIGGTATNVARWAASLGSETGLVTNIGTDIMGEMAAQHLAESPVDTTHVTRVDATSPLTLYAATEDDEHWTAWIAGSCYGFTPPADPATLVSPYEWVHLEGVTLPADVNQTAVRRLAEAAAAAGTNVSFDLNGRTTQWPTPDAYRQALQDVLQYCDLVFAGTDDLAVAGIDRTPAGVLELLPPNHSATAFITDGPAETTAMIVADGEVIEQVTATPPTASVATTAGAGDAFAGAVLAARHSGISDLKELATIGNTAGAGDAFAGAVLAARHSGISDLKELATIGNTAGAAAVSTVGPFDTDRFGAMDRLR